MIIVTGSLKVLVIDLLKGVKRKIICIVRIKELLRWIGEVERHELVAAALNSQ